MDGDMSAKSANVGLQTNTHITLMMVKEGARSEGCSIVGRTSLDRIQQLPKFEY
jgi:hypothetical protein